MKTANAPDLTIPTKMVVAHLCSEYLPLTHTFVYSFLRCFRRTRPFVISRGELVNLDLFPLPAESVRSLVSARYSLDRITRAALRRMARVVPSEDVFRRRCARWVERSESRVIHAHFGSMGIWALPVRRQTGFPLVTTFYGVDTAPDPDNPRWRQGMDELFATGDLFLAEGPVMRQRLIVLGCPPEKAEIQRIALPLGAIPFPARGIRSAGHVPILLFVGRFVEKKGLRYALEAARILHSRGTPFEFRVIGDGLLEPEMHAYTARYSLGAAVRFLGRKTPAECLEEMRRADVLLHPSVTAANGDNEGGAPTTILEAQALGLPVVATTHADIPNVVAPGESAILVGERDSEALAEAVAGLLRQPERWPAMGRAGRAFVEKHHNLDDEMETMEERYLRLPAVE